MNFKKAAAIVTTAGALAAISVPAMALENEFHGMYRAYGFITNALSGFSAAPGAFNLAADSGTDKFIEQRARVQYTAKASDDLKLVTHFELDAKFGGAATSSKYVVTDGGGLDADRLSLETKNVYLDFKIPATPVRSQVGIQPFNDSFGGLFGNFDGTGAVFNGKFDALTATYGYFTINRDAVNSIRFDAFRQGSNAYSQDLNVLDFKYAVSKDLSLGASYYMLLDKTAAPDSKTLVNNTVGLNAAGKFGPVALNGAVGVQFGKQNNNSLANYLPTTGGAVNLTNNGTFAMAAALNAKVAVGPGSVNLAGLYLSGDRDAAPNGYNHGWNPIGAGVTYYAPANMWLLTRNIATINSSTSIGTTTGDLSNGGKGIIGVFAGYEGTAGKIFYNGNVGWARVAERQGADSANIGTELNATIGYKLYDSMSASLIGAYAILGDGYGKANAPLLNGLTVAKSYDNPFLTAIALNYAF